MKDLHESVQWILDFLNLGCIPGEPNPWRLPIEKRELKRPPLPPKDKSNCAVNSNGLKDARGYEWRFSLERQLELERPLEFDGRNSVPTLEDFKSFFLNRGIPPKKGDELFLENGEPLSLLNTEITRPKNWRELPHYEPLFEERWYSHTLGIWGELSRILSNWVFGTKTYVNEPSASEMWACYKRGILEKYKKCLMEDEIPMESGYSKNLQAEFRGIYDITVDSLMGIDSFPHYGILPQALYACILSFAIKHKESWSCLRQCLFCGNYWVKDDASRRGRVPKYCNKNCETKFNQQSRANDTDNKRKYRNLNRTKAKKAIIGWLLDNQYGMVKSEEIYDTLPDKAKASKKEFLRIWARPRGYEK